MTDREMLLFAYGALKALEHGQLSNTEGVPSVVKIIEEYLWPENILTKLGKKSNASISNV